MEQFPFSDAVKAFEDKVAFVGITGNESIKRWTSFNVVLFTPFYVIYYDLYVLILIKLIDSII